MKPTRKFSNRVKAALARWLVRWASRWIDASYSAYVRRESGGVPSWWDKPWAYGAGKVSGFAIPLASRLDNRATGAEMAEHGWWG